MRTRILIIAAAAAALFVSCKKEDPDKISFAIEGDASFEKIELVESVDATVTVNAPGKLKELTLAFNLGDINSIVNQHIGIAANKGLGSKRPVFDLIGDATVVTFLQGMGIQAGASLEGEESYSFPLSRLMLALVNGQPIENNTTFSVDIIVKDQGGRSASRTAKFHFTSAPVINWKENPDFGTVTINPSYPALPNYYQVAIAAPGRIRELSVTLDETSSDPKLKQWILNRVTGNHAVIDFVTDPMAIAAFSDWTLPKNTIIKGAEKVTLDFRFMESNLYDFTGGITDTFTLSVTDSYGKQTQAVLKFRIEQLYL